jgi:hypothetical protein
LQFIDDNFPEKCEPAFSSEIYYVHICFICGTTCKCDRNKKNQGYYS